MFANLRRPFFHRNGSISVYDSTNVRVPYARSSGLISWTDRARMVVAPREESLRLLWIQLSKRSRQ